MKQTRKLGMEFTSGVMDGLIRETLRMTLEMDMANFLMKNRKLFIKESG